MNNEHYNRNLFLGGITILLFLSVIGVTNAALTDGLVDYFGLNNASSSTTTFYSSVSTRTIFAVNPNSSSAGIPSINLYGVNTYTASNVRYVAEDSVYNATMATGNFTMAVWLNITEENALNTILRIGGSSATPDYNGGCLAGAGGEYRVWWQQDENRFKLTKSNKGCTIVVTAQTAQGLLELGVWNLYTMVVNNNDAVLYINNIKVAQMHDNQSIQPATFSYIVLGGENGAIWNTGGIIDEVMYWNRSLTEAEITSLYNNNIGLFYPLNSFNYSLYNVTFPYLDNHITSNNNLTYGFNTSDPDYNYTIYSISTYSDLFCEQENANEASDCGGLSTGTYATNITGLNLAAFYDSNWGTQATGSNNMGAVFANWTKPLDATGAIWQVKFEVVGATYNFTIPDSCIMDTVQIKMERIQIGESVNMNISCYDNTGWTNISYLQGRSGYWEDKMFWYGMYNKSRETINTSYTWHNLPDGKYYYDLTIYDINGGIGYYDPNITIDTTPPIINFSTGTTPNGSYLSSNSIFVNLSVVEENLNTTSIFLYNETGALISSIIYPYTEIQMNFTNLSVGKYYYNATATDLAGYSASTETWEADIVGNFSLPYYSVTVKYPTGTYTNDDTYYVIANNTDPYFSSWNITMDDQTNISTDNNFRVDYGGLSDGLHNLTIIAKDLADNNYLWQSYWTIDTTPPTINFSSGTPPNGSVINVENIFINLSIIEENINVTSISLYNDDGLYDEVSLSAESVGLCYQESADTPNQTGIDGGCNLQYDGAFYSVANDGYVYINYTIPIGANTDSLWQIKYGLNDTTYIPVFKNYTLPNSCWYSDKLSLRLWSGRYDGIPAVSSECYNGTNWVLIDYLYTFLIGVSINHIGGISILNDGNYSNYQCSHYSWGWFINFEYPDMYDDLSSCTAAGIWDEAMIWNISATSVTFTNLPNGRYYYNATVTDLVGHSASTDTWETYILSNFSENFYNVTFPYPENYYLNQSTLTYGFTTTDPYYDYASYYISAYEGHPFAAPSCFQESFNTSNQTGIDGPCELNYTGTSNVPAAFNDGDYSSAFTVNNSMTYYINYTLPSATNLTVIWQIKEQHSYPYGGGGQFILYTG